MLPTRLVVQGVQNLWTSSEHWDFKVIAGSTTFKVHKCIISAQGGFFGKVCKGGFKEATTNQVDLSSEDTDTIHEALKHLYGFYLKIPETRYSPAAFYVRVYAAANFYQLPRLQNEALDEFRDIAFDVTDRVVECFQAAPLIYELSAEDDDRLKKPLVAMTHLHMAMILYNDEEAETNMAILRKIPDFAADILAFSSRVASIKQFEHNPACAACWRCGSGPLLALHENRAEQESVSLVTAGWDAPGDGWEWDTAQVSKVREPKPLADCLQCGAIYEEHNLLRV